MLKRQREGSKPLILSHQRVYVVGEDGARGDEGQQGAYDVGACSDKPAFHAPDETGDSEAGGVPYYGWEGGQADQQE